MFTQMYFWIFFGIVLSIYSIIYPAKAARNGFLFFASLFFYWKTSGLFFLLLIFSTIVGYFLGLGNYRAKKKSVKKLFVAGSIIVNLGLLSYFKYSYFVTETINNWFRTDFEVFNFLAAMSNSITGSKFDVAVIGEGELTIVVAAHRLSTIRRADQIVVLDQGRVVEIGNWNDLNERPDGRFRAMAKADK